MASKGKGKKEQVKSPPQPVEVEQPEEKEIVPGKITENDWLSLLSGVDGVETVSSLVEDVFDIAFSIINAHYLEKQSFPHTIQNAKESLVKIIEWQFLARDEGERDTLHDPSWIEDEEPSSAIIDSWARGVVPQASETRLLSAMSTADPISVLSQEALDDDVTTRPLADLTAASPTSRPLSSSLAGGNKPSSRSSSIKARKLSNQNRDEGTSKTRRSRPVARGPKARMVALEKAPLVEDNDGEDPDHNDSLERYPSPVRSHTPTSFTSITPSHKLPLPFNMKPAQLAFQKGVTYDEHGNIIAMVKLDPRKFPSHVIKPEVTIIKPPSNSRPRHRRTLKTTSTTQQQQQQQQRHHHNNHAATSYGLTTTRTSNTSRRFPGKPVRRLAANERGVMNRGGGVGGKLSTPRGPTTAENDGRGTSYSVTGSTSKRFPENIALPALIDTIDPVQGVTIRESGKTFHGPVRHRSLQPPGSPPRHKLRPIRPIDGGSGSHVTGSAVETHTSVHVTSY